MKKIYYVLSAILLLLIITNPSITSFKSFLGEKQFQSIRKKTNFFVCSIYSVDDSDYFAITGNFFKINRRTTIPIDTIAQHNEDSVLRAMKEEEKREKAVNYGRPIFHKKLPLKAVAKLLRNQFPPLSEALSQDIDDKTLVKNFLQAYPQYKDSIKN